MLNFLYSPYMTTGKTIALTRQTLVSKAMPLIFNILSRLVIAFLPRNKNLNKASQYLNKAVQKLIDNRTP